jgi:hypothetical protein
MNTTIFITQLIMYAVWDRENEKTMFFYMYVSVCSVGMHLVCGQW